jgi:hypothetical protein
VFTGCGHNLGLKTKRMKLLSLSTSWLIPEKRFNL